MVCGILLCFFFKQKTAYEMRSRDWSSDVCSSDLACPAGVDQPAIDTTARDPLLEQIAVDRRMARHERRAEAGRKGRLWLGDADLGARDLGGIAGQEVIHGLIGRQPGDRRQYAERIGGQHENGSANA